MNDDLQNFGPAMRALNDRQRRFVIAMLTEPFKPATHWARVAGYLDNGGGSVRVRAHYLVHDDRIEAAIAEVCRGTMNILGPVLATQGLIRIAKNPKHPKHHWALEKLANRVGFHETTEHKVSVEHSGGGDIVQRIKDAAALLGVDPGQLLGANTPVPMKVIEGSVSRETEKSDGVAVRSD